jgi:lipopolysaccharide transport protein LptA
MPSLAARLLVLVPALALCTALAAQGGASCNASLDIASESFAFDGNNNQNLTHFVKPTIKQCNLEIKADEAFSTGVDIDVRSEWRLNGHVRITIGSNTMEAQSAVFTFEKKQLAHAELAGTPASFTASRTEPGKEPIHGTATKISFDNVAQTLRMSEGVVVTQDRYHVQGCDVIYDLKNEGLAAGPTNCGDQAYKIRILPAAPQAKTAPAAAPP